MNLNGNITVSITDNKSKPDSKESVESKSPSNKASPTSSDNNKKKGDVPLPLTRNRCNKCNKKLKLTAFKCRCDYYYCDTHRYSDCHDCKFDYKKKGKELLEKNNPLVIHKKVDKF
jgi:AN1-type zinc finger protein 5/6